MRTETLLSNPVGSKARPGVPLPARVISMAAILALLVPGGAGAEEPVLQGNVISMGYGEGTPGQRGVRVIVTARNETPIQGYSVAFTFPTEALKLVSVSTAGTHVDALAPDFASGWSDNQLGIGRIGVILPFSEPFELKQLEPLPASSYPRIVARITFDVKADARGGVYPLQLVDGIGQPASFNRFTNGGSSIAPKLEHGSFRVAGGNVLTLEKKPAFPGIQSTHHIIAYAQHPKPLDGFQIAFSYPKSSAQITAVTFAGTSVQREIGASQVEAYAWNADTSFTPSLGRVAVACLFDALPPVTGEKVLPPCDARAECQSLSDITVVVFRDADKISQSVDLTLRNEDIPGILDNRFIVRDTSVDPQLSSGKIYFSTGYLEGRIVDSVSLAGVGGVSVQTAPDGYSATTGLDGRFRIAGPQNAGIPPGRYDLLLSEPRFYAARWSKTVAGVPIVVSGENATDSVGNIPLYRIPPSTTGARFQRGLVNSDPRMDLSDSVFLLQYLFQGTEAPTCSLAADINDDEQVDISDAIYLLSFLFLGEANPPPPFAEGAVVCEPDPTPGPLDCASFPHCP